MNSRVVKVSCDLKKRKNERKMFINGKQIGESGQPSEQDEKVQNHFGTFFKDFQTVGKV